jgi:hypothetical protein
MSRCFLALVLGVLTFAPVDALAGQESRRVGLSQPRIPLAFEAPRPPITAFDARESRRQRTWTIVGGVVGAVVGYTVVRDHIEVPSGTFRAAALAAGMAAIGAFIGYVVGS